ncbi:MAG: potassium channel family protein [Microbacterium sp.]
MAAPRTELKSTGYEIFIGLLSLLSIVNIVLVYAFVRDPAMQQILSVMNGLFSVIFLCDFIFRIRTAPSAGAYFFRHFGWADLLASLPFPQAKILRVFRLVRVARLMRDVGPRNLWGSLVRDRAGSALLLLLLMGILVLQFGSLFVLRVEQYANGANITSASDAIWYTIVTISTVGYGDQYPVTEAGRIIGAMIIVIGVGIFGTFTGYLANLFLAPTKSDEEPDAAAGVSADAGVVAPAVSAAVPAAATTEELRELLARSEANLAEMRALLGAREGGSGSAPA